MFGGYLVTKRKSLEAAGEVLRWMARHCNEAAGEVENLKGYSATEKAARASNVFCILDDLETGLHNVNRLIVVPEPQSGGDSRPVSPVPSASA